MPAPDIVLQRPSEDLFLATLDGQEVCRAAIAVGPGVWEFYSTVTASRFEGQGIASKVVRYALEEARAAGVRVIPSCWYVSGLMDRHAPEYDDLRGPAAGAREQ